MLNCKLNVDGKYSYTLATFDPINKIIWWNRKKCNFKAGDFYRVKGSNGYIKEVEIKEIRDDGYVETVGYSSFRWHSARKMHKKGKMTHSVTLSSLDAEDMFFDIQCRGHKFHKIKKLSPKYKRVKNHFVSKW
jgi:hypothetical protein